MSVDSKLLKILNIDLKIETNIFQTVKFRDDKLEKIYSSKVIKNEIFLQGERIIVIGWLSILLYVYYAYYRPESLILNLFFSQLV
jgi:hypothetical protein